MTPSVATGKLRAFLERTQNKNSKRKQLDKFTRIDESTGERRFALGAQTSLEAVDEATERKVRAAFGRDGYGATLQKVGWQVRQWNSVHFRVLDVAARVGSGVGSFGVGRYYVLLAGEDVLGVSTGGGGEGGGNAPGGIILDVKFEPQPAVSRAIGDADQSWYHTIFANEAMRAVEAQRRLTSYTDPYTGWVVLDGKAYTVRQRSPYKESLDLDSLTTYAELAEYVEQIAMITATSHTRGTVGKPPGTFKEVIAAAFGSTYARATWGVSVAKIAAAYREQVLLDYQCFREYAESVVGPLKARDPED